MLLNRSKEFSQTGKSKLYINRDSQNVFIKLLTKLNSMDNKENWFGQ